MLTQKMNPADASPSPPSAWTHRPLLTTLPTTTTTMTGLRTCCRGESSRNAAKIAGPIRSDVTPARRRGAVALETESFMESMSEEREVLGDRAERQRGQEGERADHDDGRGEQHDEER